jgi:uncharacterized protein YlxW (UPF0749 family)
MRDVSAPPAPPAPGSRRVDGSMSLLVDVMTNTMDEAYAERAARKAGGDTGPAVAARRAPPAVAVVVALVLLGVATGAAVSQVREREEADDVVRGDLAAEVQERSAEGDALEQQVRDLRVEVVQTRDDALGADAAGVAAAEAVRELELAAGTTPVVGPGIVLIVDDAPPDQGSVVDPRGGTPAVSRVNDRDLQGVVNGLWAAGAEAVAINGVRLSSRSAIRSAGEAVLVDFRPLSPPYVVEAVGRPADLEVGFVDGKAGRALRALAELTGITWSLERQEELRLSAAREPDLRAARPLEGPS